ncbi:hypothetical protein NXS19_014080 [Fusarium pseudograminearum]|nr:hypothetical protein NXS19_014080 [Fusarium pseudograminearum]
MEGSSRDIKDEPDLELGPEPPKPVVASTEAELPSSPKGAAAALRKDKARVRFNSNAAANPPQSPANTPATPQTLGVARPRPSLLRGSSAEVVKTLNLKEDADDESDPESKEAMVAARERARIMADNIHNDSSAIDRDSLESTPVGTPGYDSPFGSSIPLQDLTEAGSSKEGFQAPLRRKRGPWLERRGFQACPSTHPTLRTQRQHWPELARRQGNQGKGKTGGAHLDGTQRWQL